MILAFFDENGREQMIKCTLCYIEDNGKYLMMFRNKKENDPNAGKWIGIGGKFLEGETAEECMLREVREETGLTLSFWQFHGIVEFRSDAWEFEDMYLFSAKAPEGASVDPDRCSEGTLQWIEKEKVLQLPIWEGDRLFLEKLIAGEDAINMTLKYQGENLVREDEVK